MQLFYRAKGCLKPLGADCGFPGCLQAGVSQGWFPALCSEGWVQSSLASRGEFGFSFWTSEEGPVGKMKQTRRVQALWVHTQPREGPDNREDSPGVHGPANLWQPVLVQAPSSYTAVIATAHRRPGRKLKGHLG